MHADPASLWAETTSKASALRFEVLDSWRGIAAIMIVLHHAEVVSHLHDLALIRASAAVVDFFFVLSGFVIAHAYFDRIRHTRDFGRFLMLRLARLYPLHLTVLALAVGFELAKYYASDLSNPQDPPFSGTNAPGAIIENLLLLNSVRLNSLLTWNTPAWSISAEFFAYLGFGLAVLFLRRRIRVLLVAAMVVAAFLLMTASDQGMTTTAYMGAARAVYGFSAGALLYLLSGTRLKALRDKAASGGTALAMWSAMEVMTVAAAAGMMIWSSGTAYAYLIPFLFCVVVAIFAVEAGLVSRLLQTKPFLFIGLISYSIYVTHMFVMLRLTNLARESDLLLGTDMVKAVGTEGLAGDGFDLSDLYQGDLLMLAMLVPVIFVGWLAYRFVERNGQRVMRGWSERLIAR